MLLNDRLLEKRDRTLLGGVAYLAFRPIAETVLLMQEQTAKTRSRQMDEPHRIAVLIGFGTGNTGYGHDDIRRRALKSSQGHGFRHFGADS